MLHGHAACPTGPPELMLLHCSQWALCSSQMSGSACMQADGRLQTFRRQWQAVSDLQCFPLSAAPGHRVAARPHAGLPATSSEDGGLKARRSFQSPWKGSVCGQVPCAHLLSRPPVPVGWTLCSPTTGSCLKQRHLGLLVPCLPWEALRSDRIQVSAGKLKGFLMVESGMVNPVFQTAAK